MELKDAEAVMLYYAQLPRMIRETTRELGELEEQYNPIRSAGMDGMPKAVGNGDRTADLATKMADRDALGRIRAVETRLVVMRQDRDDIERALREVHRVHKTILVCHYVKGHTWTATAIQAGYSQSHTRRLKSRALEMMGNALDEGPMPGELVARARDAHI